MVWHKRVFTQTHCCAAVILEKDGRFLLVKEASKGPDKGKWNHPAGWIDVGEKPQDAAVKEAKEETGYDFEPEYLVGVYSLVREDLRGHFDAGLPHAIKLVYGGRFSGQPAATPNEEIAELRWFTPEEIYSMNVGNLRDADVKKIIKDYLAGRRYPLESVSHTVSQPL